MANHEQSSLEVLALRNTLDDLEIGVELLEIRYDETARESCILALDVIMAIKAVLGE